MNIMKAGTAVAVGLMLSGCHIIYGKAAMEAGPSAEEAVQKLDDFNWLMGVIRDGKNPKARVLAVKKIRMPHILNNIIRDNDQAEVRAAALERLIEIGKLDSDLRDGALEKVAKGHEYLEASRIKVIQSCSVDRSDLERVVMDNSETVAVRKAAIQKIDYMEARVLAAVLDCAADEKNPNKKACEEIVKAWLSESVAGTGDASQRNSQNDNSRKLDVLVNVVWANPEVVRSCKASSQARKLAYSLITTDEKKADALKHAVWTAESQESEENTSLVKELIAVTDKEAVLEEFVDNPGTVKDKIMPYLKMAFGRINDEKFIVKNVLEQGSLYEDDQTFLLESVNKVKDSAAREQWRDKIVAKYSKDKKERMSAFERVFNRNVQEADGLWWTWSDEDLSALKQTMLIELFKIDKDRKRIKDALRKSVIAQEKALSQDVREKLIAAQISKAKKLDSEGKTLVVGNCYVGMPMLGFLALNDSQAFKADAVRWDLDETGKKIVVKAIRWSSKDLYKATGLENAAVPFEFSAKFGIPSFKIESGSLGKVYWKSESQAKGVEVVFWQDDGILVMYKLED